MCRKESEKIIRVVARTIKDESAYKVVSALWDMGLLNRVNAERLYISREVERRVRDGEMKQRAIELVAREMNCSFEKVRAVVYRAK